MRIILKESLAGHLFVPAPMNPKSPKTNPMHPVLQGPRRSRADGNASKLLKKVTVERVASPVFQIAERMRDIIAEGGLAPGMRLPSTRELSDQLAVDPSSVHRALSILVKEGLLVRTPYVGTFVAEQPTNKLETLAFYHSATTGLSLGAFGRALLEEVTRLGHAEDFGVEVFTDTRPRDVIELSPPDDLERRAKARRIQGIISANTSPERFKWTGSLPVPFATISTPRHPHSINWDRSELSATAVRCLAEHGCRKVGMLTSLVAHPIPEADSYQSGMYNGFVRAAKELGLEVRQERLVGVPRLEYGMAEVQTAGFGFEAFNRMWDTIAPADRPDGIFIYPDTMVAGVLLALTMRNVRVPEDLRLVIHNNAEVPVFAPFPVDRLVVKVEDAARALVNHIRNQLESRPPENRILPCYLERGSLASVSPWK